MNKEKSIMEEIPQIEKIPSLNQTTENEILFEFAPKMKSFFKRNFDTISLSLQVFLDFLTILFSFQLSYFIWEYSPLTRELNIEYPSLSIILLMGLLYIFTFFWVGAYQKKSSIVNIKELKNLIRGVIVATGLAIVFSFFSRNVHIGRSQIVYFFLILLIIISIERYFFEKFQLYMIKRGIGGKRVLIYGAGEIGKRLAKSLEKYPKLGYLAVGFIDDKKNHPNVQIGNPLPILGTSSDIGRLTKIHRIDEIIFAIPSAAQSRLEQIIKKCKEFSVSYKYVPNLYDVAIQKVRSEEIDGIPLFSMKHLQYKKLNEYLKTGFDFFFSLTILILVSPLFPLIALAIKLDSKGPVFFRQKRVGRDNQVFTLYKFRTMFVNAPAYSKHPEDKRDPRITKVGRFLRRTSLDELPQFINVLRGEMSVVGPRPEMEFIVKNEYNELHKERLNVKPGITGLWQISADRNYPIHENIDHDLFYIENQSFLLDIIIIIKTIFIALRGIGAK